MEATKIYEFTGVASGDGECGCYEVTADEYERLNGEKPEDYDRSFVFKGLYRVYGLPELDESDFPALENTKRLQKFRITVSLQTEETDVEVVEKDDIDYSLNEESSQEVKCEKAQADMKQYNELREEYFWKNGLEKYLDQNGID